MQLAPGLQGTAEAPEVAQERVERGDGDRKVDRRLLQGLESSMRDLPCERAGAGGICAGHDGCGEGGSADLLAGLWDVTCGTGHMCYFCLDAAMRMSQGLE